MCYLLKIVPMPNMMLASASRSKREWVMSMSYRLPLLILLAHISSARMVKRMQKQNATIRSGSSSRLAISPNISA